MHGKLDWQAHNLPVEGEQAALATAGMVARNDVVTCGLEETVGGVRERIASSPYPFALVTSPSEVLLGRLRRSALDCDPGLFAGAVMESGPSTVRPDLQAAELAKRLAEKNLRWAIVTNPEGRLVGVASRRDLDAA